MKKFSHINLALILVCMLLYTQFTPAAANVEVSEIVVTSTDNEGPGTLREAVMGAGHGSTIVFDTTVFPPDKPATIHLTKSIGIEENNGIGNLVIDASNAGVILDGGNNTDTGFYISSGGCGIKGIKFINFSEAGIFIDGNNEGGRSINNTIGGDPTVGDGPYGQGNCFGNNDAGIYIQRGASDNVVTGNFIGIDVNGEAISNSSGGVIVRAGANNNTIGPNNMIANNGDFGIQVEGSDPVTITQNAIFNQNKPVDLVNGANNEIEAGVEITSIVTSMGMVSGEYMPNPIVTLEIFSGGASGPQFYVGSLELNPDDIPEGSDRSAFTMEKGSAFKGSYLYFIGTTADGRSSSFSEPVDLFSSLEEVSTFLSNPRRVWLDMFQDDSRKDMWQSNNTHQVVDGKLIFETTNDDWQMLTFGGTVNGFVQDAGESGSQAVYFTMQYSGSNSFRFQMASDSTALGLMFDSENTCFSETMDSIVEQNGQITIQPTTEYSVLLAIDETSGQQVSAIWKTGQPESALTCGGTVSPDLIENHWGFGIGASGATRIELDDFQFLAFGY
jgi:hypothetical protein